MKINWNPNPFLTTLELDDSDKHRILLSCQNEAYTDLLCDLDNKLNGRYGRPALTDLEAIKKQVDEWRDICNLEIDTESVQRYIEFANYIHMGDCTCVRGE